MSFQASSCGTLYMYVHSYGVRNITSKLCGSMHDNHPIELQMDPPVGHRLYTKNYVTKQLYYNSLTYLPGGLYPYILCISGSSLISLASLLFPITSLSNASIMAAMVTFAGSRRLSLIHFWIVSSINLPLLVLWSITVVSTPKNVPSNCQSA